MQHHGIQDSMRVPGDLLGGCCRIHDSNPSNLCMYPWPPTTHLLHLHHGLNHLVDLDGSSPNFPILGFLSEPTGNSNDPFFKCFQKEWSSCGTRLLKPHLFGYSNRSSCVSGHFRCSSMGHPGTTCAPKAYGRKKSGQDMLFWFPVTFVVLTVAFAGHVGNEIS